MKNRLLFALALTTTATVNAETKLSDPDWEFQDNFERKSLLEESTFWGNSTSTSYGESCPGDSSDGSNSLVFHYSPDEPEPGHSWSEKRFHLPIDAVQVEMSYRLYIPSNYKHAPANHKSFVLWSGTYGKANANISVSSENWPTENGASPSVYIGVDGVNFGHSMKKDRPIMFEDNLGSWIDVHVFLELAETEDDFGRLEIFKDGEYITGNMNTQVESYAKTPLQEQLRYSKSGNFIDQGYLLGWANGGFKTETDFCIDNFSIRANSTHKPTLGGPMDRRPKLEPGSVIKQINN